MEALAPVIETQAKQAAQEAINDVIANKAVKSDVPTGLDVIIRESGLPLSSMNIVYFENGLTSR